MDSVVKNLPAKTEDARDSGDMARPLGLEGIVEKEMTTHSSTLAWKIPWPEEPGGL